MATHSNVITTADIALLTLIVLMISLIVSMLTNIIAKESTAWTIGSNFRRLGKKNPSPVLYGLIVMKTHAPKVKLADAYRANPGLFRERRLLDRVYGSNQA